MNILYLAGNSLNNKTWIEKIKSEFNFFSTGEILNYTHWTNGGKFIDFETEENKLSKLVQNQKDYFIFAKSVGSILTLKSIFDKKINPKKIILCGHPYLLAKELNFSIDDYLKSLTIPTVFIQNEIDPLYSFAKLEQTLKENQPSDYKLVKNPNNDTHDYQNYPNLINLVKGFFT